MDVGSKNGYPSAALSNFSPHPFVLDGVHIASMEGFLQSLKFKDIPIQLSVCTLVGYAAKKRGYKKNWQESQTLHWQGVEYPRDSKDYADLLERAYTAMFEQSVSFRRALKASGKAVFTHSIGRNKTNETVLTEREFCRLLTQMREKL